MGQVKMQDRLRPVLVAVLALVCDSCATRPCKAFSSRQMNPSLGGPEFQF
jgi:hypothetical protein